MDTGTDIINNSKKGVVGHIKVGARWILVSTRLISWSQLLDLGLGLCLSVPYPDFFYCLKAWILDLGFRRLEALKLETLRLDVHE